MRRAMREEQKQARRQQIIEMAWQLFQDNPYEAVNVIDVARGVGLAKGTVYLYFKTKEALFLAVLSQQFAAWFDVVDGRLAELPDEDPITAVTAVFSDTLGERPFLTRLFAILHVVLEKNIDLETALTFKQLLRTRISHTGSLLEEKLPFLTAGQGAQLLLQAYALVIGFQHLAEPAPVIRQALARPDMEIFIIEFAPAFAATLRSLMRGMQTESLESS